MVSHPATLVLARDQDVYSFAVRWRSTGGVNGNAIDDALALILPSKDPSDWSICVHARVHDVLYSSPVVLRDNGSHVGALLTSTLLPPRLLNSFWQRAIGQLSRLADSFPAVEYTFPVSRIFTPTPLFKRPLAFFSSLLLALKRFLNELRPARWEGAP